MTCYYYIINKYTSPDCTNKICTAQLHEVWEVKVLVAISEYIGMTSPVMTLCPEFKHLKLLGIISNLIPSLKARASGEKVYHNKFQERG